MIKNVHFIDSPNAHFWVSCGQFCSFPTDLLSYALSTLEFQKLKSTLMHLMFCFSTQCNTNRLAHRQLLRAHPLRVISIHACTVYNSFSAHFCHQTKNFRTLSL